MAQGFGAEQEMGMWREKDEESEEERGSTTKFEMVNGDSDGETLIDIDQDIEFGLNFFTLPFPPPKKRKCET